MALPPVYESDQFESEIAAGIVKPRLLNITEWLTNGLLSLVEFQNLGFRIIDAGYLGSDSGVEPPFIMLRILDIDYENPTANTGCEAMLGFHIVAKHTHPGKRYQMLITAATQIKQVLQTLTWKGSVPKHRPDGFHGIWPVRFEVLGDSPDDPDVIDGLLVAHLVFVDRVPGKLGR